jgi:hypothetical protein
MKRLVDRCYNELLPRWQDRLADSATYLRDNCWARSKFALVMFVLIVSKLIGADFCAGKAGRPNEAVDGAEGEHVVRAAAVAGWKQLRAGIGDQSAGDVAGREV